MSKYITKIQSQATGDEYLIAGTSVCSWGSISGTLSAQTDLQTELNKIILDEEPFTGTTVTIEPNKMYVYSGSTGLTTLTVKKGTDVANKVNHYFVRFKTGTSFSVVWSGFSLTWYGGTAPTWESNKTYEVSIIDNFAVYGEF